MNKSINDNEQVTVDQALVAETPVVEEKPDGHKLRYTGQGGKLKHVIIRKGEVIETSDSRVVVLNDGIKVYYGMDKIMRATLHRCQTNVTNAYRKWKPSLNN